MPKAPKNILDRLNKILKTRQDALNRFDRRSRDSNIFFGQRDPEWYDGNANALEYAPEDYKKRFKGLRDAAKEASYLVDNLDEAAGIEYDRIIRSKPGKRVEREAIRLMPDYLVRDNGWY